MISSLLIKRLVIVCFVVLSAMGINHAQLQEINISGIVMDESEHPIPNAQLLICFNGIEISQTQSNNEGSYEMNFSNYGGIETITIQVKANRFEEIKPFELPVKELSVKRNFTMQKTPNRRDYHRYTNCIHWRSTIDENQMLYCTNHVAWSSQPRIERNITQDCFGNQSINYLVSENKFRSPYGVYANKKPEEYFPEIYQTKVSSQFTIVNEHGNPIDKTLVEIFIPGDTKRWGMTNRNGQLDMKMEFKNGALNGKIFISAEGYKTRKLRFQTFYATNSNKIVLHKY